ATLAEPTPGAVSNSVTIVSPAYDPNLTNNSTTIDTTVNALPAISSFTPTSGSAGTSVTISGQNFTGATAVAFGGTPASDFVVDSDTQIRADIASGTTSGTVSVTTPVGTGTSGAKFWVPSTIADFSPGSGGVH